MTESNSYWKNLTKKYSKALDPLDRLTEIICGLIMVLTFTCSIGAATAGRAEIKTMLWGALGCNTSWGIVDACMILMATLIIRGEEIKALKSLQNASTIEEANNIIRENLPPVFKNVLKQEQVDNLRIELLKLPESPKNIFFTSQDFRNGIVVFILVFVSTFPPILPFILIKDPISALRVSNVVALLLLFITGFFLGRKTGFNSFLMGIIFAVIGACLVSLTIALGG